MDKKLIGYIKAHVEHGTDINKVRSILLNAKHDLNVVEETISHVLRHHKLREPIKKHVQKGGDIKKLRQSMADAGYDMEIVEEYIADALKVGKNKKMAFIGVVLIIMILASLLGFYGFGLINKKMDRPESIKIEEGPGSSENFEIFNRALIANDSSMCRQISHAQLRSECSRKFSYNFSNWNSTECGEPCESQLILNSALISRNLSVCREIKNEGIRSLCVNRLKE